MWLCWEDSLWMKLEPELHKRFRTVRILLFIILVGYFRYIVLESCHEFVVGMSILFSAEDLFVVVGLQDLAAKMEERLGSAKKVKKYSSRNRLRRDMLTLNPAYEIFVSGSKSGSDKFFFCRVCHRDVGMKAQGAGEFARHFRSDGHWFRMSRIVSTWGFLC